mgnify:CR=1 FL=1
MASPGELPFDRPLTVSEVTAQVKAVLDDSFSSVCVEGEISGLRTWPSGHLFFSLKDESTVLPAIVWRSNAMRLRFEPHDGMHVVAWGRISVYEPQGRYQLYVDRMVAEGAGALDAAFRRLKEELFVHGYFDPARKRPIPASPQRIGVVTSPAGAAVRDIIVTLRRRWPVAEVVIAPVRVQGSGAAEEIAAAIGLLNRLHAAGRMRFDVLIVGRGGGSLEDLWAFNERAVADAIFFSTIPIISGVGHETDLTISDLVADLRALTPTDAAVKATPDRMEQMRQVESTSSRMRTSLLRRVEAARQRLENLAGRRPFRYPLERVQTLGQRLDELAERLKRRRPLELVRMLRERLETLHARASNSIRQALDRNRTRVASLASHLAALSPMNVLSRGYSLTLVRGRVLRDAGDVTAGEAIETVLARGRLTSRVESLNADRGMGSSNE